jgi:hypothetical protein
MNALQGFGQAIVGHGHGAGASAHYVRVANPGYLKGDQSAARFAEVG